MMGNDKKSKAKLSEQRKSSKADEMKASKPGKKDLSFEKAAKIKVKSKPMIKKDRM